MADEPTLRRGHSNPHEWVVYAQQTLNYARAGGLHLDVPENGIFDEAFEQEVIAFQSEHGLDRDGVIGPHVWAALNSAVTARKQATEAAAAAADDQLQSAPHEVHSAPGDEDLDNRRQRTDEHGNTVVVYDVDGEEISAGPKRGLDDVVDRMFTHAKANINMQLVLIDNAVQGFGGSSTQRIQTFGQDAHQFVEQSHVQFPWGFVIDVLQHEFETVFELPWICKKAVDWVTGTLTSELEKPADSTTSLVDRLTNGVAFLVEGVSKQTHDGTVGLDEVLKRYIRDAMDQYLKDQGAENATGDRLQEFLSVNTEWIDAMVEYFGFPGPGTSDASQSLLHDLNQQFDAMINQAMGELLASG
jgi:hypothetical protein